jgi:hypothetical protein
MKTNEFLKEDDHEASMARAELVQIAKNAIALAKIIHEGDDLPGWVSSYITLANDHLNSVHEYMEYNCNKEPTIAENASVGSSSSGAIATSMGGGAGFGKSIFMSRKGPVKTKKTK